MRTNTPPFFARKGKICPGLTRSLLEDSGSIATLMVCALSAAEIPVEMPFGETADYIERRQEREVLRNKNPAARKTVIHRIITMKHPGKYIFVAIGL